jgi:hypothetical protein
MSDKDEKTYDETIAEIVRSQDERELALGDTFDIKTSIALVVITFLATQSAEFLKEPLSACWHIAQQVSVGFLVIAGALALIELVPRDYRLRMAPDEFLHWVDEVKASYRKSAVQYPEREAIEHIKSIEIEKIKARFSANSSINEQKSWLMNWSFRATMVAVILNLATLVSLSIGC